MVQLGSVTVDDSVASCIRTQAAQRGAPEGYMMAGALLTSFFDPNFRAQINNTPTYYEQDQLSFLSPVDGHLWHYAGLFGVHWDNAIGYALSGDQVWRPADASRVAAGFFRAGFVNATYHAYVGDAFVQDVFSYLTFWGALNSVLFFGDDPALRALLLAHGWNGSPGVTISLERAALAALGVADDGSVAGWPPNDPSLCGGIINPPPPLGAWCEPFIPTDADTADQIYTAHLDRMDALSATF